MATINDVLEKLESDPQGKLHLRIAFLEAALEEAQARIAELEGGDDG